MGISGEIDRRAMRLVETGELSRTYEEDGFEIGVPAACYPPEADFLVRSEKRPGEVIRTPEQFRDLRERHRPVESTNRWGVTWAAPVDDV